MVKSKYVSVTQMCNDKSNDDLLREAIANFGQETPGTREWDKAFTNLWSLILKCKIPRKSPHPKYPDVLQEIQLECSQRISTEFDSKKGKNLQHSLKLWFNYRKKNYGLGLQYKILEVYQEDKKKLQREISLDAAISGGNNYGNIPTLGDVIAGNIPEPMETLIQQESEDFLEKVSAAIQKLDFHLKGYPQCTSWELFQRRLLRKPPQIWEEIANELQVPQGTVTSHWHRKCKPLFKQIYNDISGDK